MLVRELKDITVKQFTNGLDEYGQKRQKGYTTRIIKGVVNSISKMNVDNPKYVDIDIMVLTEDKSLADSNTLEIDGKEYQIKYITGTKKKYNMVFCEWLK